MRYLFMTLLLLSGTGCLNFGSDIETNSPTEEQITFCREVMHISDGIDIEPLGIRILGSGIDDAVWFKFETAESDLSALFDEEFVPADSLEGDVTFHSGEEMPEWWDAGNRTFTGGTVPLQGGTWITVGFQKEENRTICYVFWHET